ncbi:hypothetical protein [Actinoallomurus acaciae]|uniref:Uncharacterized protein n=1 Tax=Actinoallomurus acaciae TaxID=502577 RepID=A0ABV5YQM5_9ACTN
MIALWRGDTRLPALAPQALLFWCAALPGTLSDSLYIPAIVAGVLAAARNIHGGALVLGVLLGLITLWGMAAERETAPPSRSAA